MKGSQIGRVVTSASGATAFEEWHAETLSAAEIAEVLIGVEGIVADGVDDLLVFSYPRDWTQGERIWTPNPRRVEAARAKYSQRIDGLLERRRRAARAAAGRADLHAVPADRPAARPPDGLPAHQAGELLHPRRREQAHRGRGDRARTSASIWANRSAPATPRPTTSSPPAASPSSSAATRSTTRGFATPSVSTASPRSANCWRRWATACE